MLKRVLHISLSVAIAALLLLNGISHEFLHSFTGHEDTVDCVHHDGDAHASFEKVHHHCDFLDLQTPVFLTSTLHFSFYTPFAHNDFFVLQTQKGLSPEAGHTALRGPPALI
ncbi:hypothetical protein [Taibaiella koreensis]|uniref:hypothetical protein n=1 Tax=Taibaiella koreensis TaxID=1268548 RepID=UPI000E59A28A|nr:hypothetical protein [Taibaiella koreensis]